MISICVRLDDMSSTDVRIGTRARVAYRPEPMCGDLPELGGGGVVGPAAPPWWWCAPESMGLASEGLVAPLPCVAAADALAAGVPAGTGALADSAAFAAVSALGGAALGGGG